MVDISFNLSANKIYRHWIKNLIFFRVTKDITRLKINKGLILKHKGNQIND
jgi:hypothetical protein